MKLGYVIGLVCGWVIGVGWCGGLTRRGTVDGLDLLLAAIVVTLGYGVVWWVAR